MILTVTVLKLFNKKALDKRFCALNGLTADLHFKHLKSAKLTSGIAIRHVMSDAMTDANIA